MRGAVTVTYASSGDLRGRRVSVTEASVRRLLGRTPKEIEAKLIHIETKEIVLRGTARLNLSGRYYFLGVKLREGLPMRTSDAYLIQIKSKPKRRKAAKKMDREMEASDFMDVATAAPVIPSDASA